MIAARHRAAALLLVFLAVAGSAGAQELPKLSISAGMGVPMGGTAYLYSTFGADAGLSVSWALPFAPILGVQGRLGYDYVPTDAGGTVHLLYGAGGVDLNVLRLGPFRLKLTGLAGYSYYLHSTAGNSGGAFYYSGGADVSFAVSRALSLGLGARYQGALGRWEGLAASAGVSIALGDTTIRPQLKIQSTTIQPVFPVFLKWYDDNAVGSLLLKNGEQTPARNVTVSLFIKEFMDAPRVAAPIAAIASGAVVEVPVFVLLSDSILGVTEAMKVPAEITITYDAASKGMKVSTTETVRVENRNAMSWADDRRAAAFVTPKDPMVLKLSKGIAGRVRALPEQAFDLNLRIAAATLEALRLYGVGYVVDPASSYAELSAADGVVDYLQFPRQTLEYRSGDCDDLTILYCALLESVGVETAFITVPGHILPAFALSLTPSEAARSFSSGDRYVVLGDKVWIPVEATLLGSGFMSAWLRGLQGWREAGAEARLYPIREAWATFEAVGIRAEDVAVSYPSEADVVAGYSREMQRIIALEMGPEEEKYLTAAASGSPRGLNKLGVLYARYGVMDKASAAFEKAAAAGYRPAMHNLGSVAYSLREYPTAIQWYRTALEADGQNAAARIGLARSLFEAGRVAEAQAEYARAEAADPAAAVAYAYLKGRSEQTGRASGVSTAGGKPEYIEEE